MGIDHQQLVLEQLLDGCEITQRISAHAFNCWRLASVVNRLKRRGFPIVTTLKKGNNGAYYGVYHL